VNAGAVSPESAPAMVPLANDRPSQVPADYLLADMASAAMPELQVARDGATTTFVLPAAAPAPSRLTTAFRVLRVEALRPEAAYVVLRNYMLHLPCRTLVRDLFIAPALWPDAWPLVDFYLPGPSGTPPVETEPGQPHLRRLNLSARIEQLPAGPAAFEIDEAADQRAAIEGALARAGCSSSGWRGWRCRMAYPVPLVEMQLALRFAGR